MLWPQHGCRGGGERACGAAAWGRPEPALPLPSPRVPTNVTASSCRRGSGPRLLPLQGGSGPAAHLTSTCITPAGGPGRPDGGAAAEPLPLSCRPGRLPGGQGTGPEAAQARQEDGRERHAGLFGTTRAVSSHSCRLWKSIADSFSANLGRPTAWEAPLQAGRVPGKARCPYVPRMLAAREGTRVATGVATNAP